MKIQISTTMSIRHNAREETMELSIKDGPTINLTYSCALTLMEFLVLHEDVIKDED